jgi:hypothetical protein
VNPPLMQVMSKMVTSVSRFPISSFCFLIGITTHFSTLRRIFSRGQKYGGGGSVILPMPFAEDLHVLGAAESEMTLRPNQFTRLERSSLFQLYGRIQSLRLSAFHLDLHKGEKGWRFISIKLQSYDGPIFGQVAARAWNHHPFSGHGRVCIQSFHNSLLVAFSQSPLYHKSGPGANLP